MNDVALAGPVIGGNTLAMIGSASLSGPEELLLYTRAAGGWSAARPPAVYPFADLYDHFTIAAGSGVVAINGDPDVTLSSSACATPMFTAGPSGFSGMLSPAACLTSPPGFGPVAANADTIVETTSRASSVSVSVFAKPAAGWAGTIAPAAQLQASDGSYFTSVSMSGSTIAAVGGTGTSTVYIFTEPAGGWSGVIHQTAQFSLPGDITTATLSGKTLTATGTGVVIDSGLNIDRTPIYVVRRPAAGWQVLTSPRPAAYWPGQDPVYGPGLGSIVPIGATTALTNIRTCSDEGYPPCDTTIYAVNGLSSTVPAPEQLPLTPSSSEFALGDGTSLASDGTTLALGANGVYLYTIAHTPPARVSHAAFTGLTGTKPHPVLKLTVAAGKGAPAITSLRVLVPTGLGGSGHSRGISLPSTQRTTIVTLHHLHLTPALRRTIGRIAAHGGRTSLTVPVQLIDTADHASESQVTLTITH